jgi:hypothetical protein
MGEEDEDNDLDFIYIRRHHFFDNIGKRSDWPKVLLHIPHFESNLWMAKLAPWDYQVDATSAAVKQDNRSTEEKRFRPM